MAAWSAGCLARQVWRAGTTITNSLLLCCLRPVFLSVTKQAAGSGGPVSRNELSTV